MPANLHQLQYLGYIGDMCHARERNKVVSLQLNLEMTVVTVPVCFNSRELWRCDMRWTIAMDLLQQVREKMAFGGHYLCFPAAVQLVVTCLQKKETLGQKDQSSANDTTGMTADKKKSSAGIDALLDVVRGWLAQVFKDLYGWMDWFTDIKEEEFQVIVK